MLRIFARMYFLDWIVLIRRHTFKLIANGIFDTSPSRTGRDGKLAYVYSKFCLCSMYLVSLGIKT